MEVSYRSRVIFESLKATANYPEPIAWGHHAFLRLAAPLAAGSYNITAAAAAFGSEMTVQLVVADGDNNLNEAIHVNQVICDIAGRGCVVGPIVCKHPLLARNSPCLSMFLPPLLLCVVFAPSLNIRLATHSTHPSEPLSVHGWGRSPLWPPSYTRLSGCLQAMQAPSVWLMLSVALWCSLAPRSASGMA